VPGKHARCLGTTSGANATLGGRSAAAVGALLVVLCAAAMLVLSLLAPSASAAIVKVQAGTYLSQTAVTSITPTLPAASTSGNMLVGIVACLLYTSRCV